MQNWFQEREFQSLVKDNLWQSNSKPTYAWGSIITKNRTLISFYFRAKANEVTNQARGLSNNLKTIQKVAWFSKIKCNIFRGVIAEGTSQMIWRWTPRYLDNPLASTKLVPNRNPELSKNWFDATLWSKIIFKHYDIIFLLSF